MGKASRNKQRLTTREKIAIQREAERRASRRTRTAIASVAVIAVVAVVVALVVLKVSAGSTPSATSVPTGSQLASIVAKTTNVPASTLAAVGKGDIQSPPAPLTGQPALTESGKPQVVYVGAEYCPFCAAERWPMVVALSRFGTFSNLGATHSDPSDVYPNTKSLSFYKSSYSSKYLSFSAVEQTDPNRKPLQSPTALQNALLAKYDVPPYVPSSSQGAIPFVDIGNKFIISGASFSPQILQGKTWDQIASALADPSSPIAKAVVGTANVLTADLCKLTGGQPSNVCSTPPVTTLNGGA